jgi:hypothetical protein
MVARMKAKFGVLFVSSGIFALRDWKGHVGRDGNEINE